MKRTRSSNTVQSQVLSGLDALSRRVSSASSDLSALEFTGELTELFVSWRSCARSLQERRAQHLANLDVAAKRTAAMVVAVDQALYERSLVAKTIVALQRGDVSEMQLGEVEKEVHLTRARHREASEHGLRVEAARASLLRRESQRSSIQELNPGPTDATDLATTLKRIYFLLSLAGAPHVRVRIISEPAPGILDTYATSPRGLEVALPSANSSVCVFQIFAIPSLRDLLVAKGTNSNVENQLGQLVAGDDGCTLADARIAFEKPLFKFDASVGGRAFRWLARLAGVNVLPPLATIDVAETLTGHDLLHYLMSRLVALPG